jgi:hypothetical protein
VSSFFDKSRNYRHRNRLPKKVIRPEFVCFNEHEIVELLLTLNIPRKNEKTIGKALLKTFGSIKEIFDASIDDLMQIKGVGDSTALALKIIREANSRRSAFLALFCILTMHRPIEQMMIFICSYYRSRIDIRYFWNQFFNIFYIFFAEYSFFLSTAKYPEVDVFDDLNFISIKTKILSHFSSVTQSISPFPYIYVFVKI